MGSPKYAASLSQCCTVISVPACVLTPLQP